MPDTNLIDAALRFARSNPELVELARRHAGDLDRSVDDLLQDAIARAVVARELDPTASIELHEPAPLRVVPGGAARAS